MGCGESKHAVATANSTITRKKSKDIIETVNETSQNGNKHGSVEVKDIAEDKELKGNNVKEAEAGRLISKESPNRYFSSRKDEDVEGFASEKSEYFSPRLGSGKESSFNDCVKSDDVAGEALFQERKQETENGESAIVKEENMTKEAETGTSIVSEVPTPDGEKKQNAGKEKLAVPPS
ncbi:uncharacterized protein LOC8262396 [Ricinus communis]|uniref:uncharacterized protein LOC8262396 n=1 Tax=Ricinus communis TaxID=3988 RepID=UPI0007728139|nr:uncharacterized protein LOC8262396 [Ricinus communis]|eukprot:XP_015573305.1 uncharacterized protein LOC8262396 [Ricinus communis]